MATASSRIQRLQTGLVVLALQTTWLFASEPQWWATIGRGEQHQYFELAFRYEDRMASKGFPNHFLEAGSILDITRRSLGRQRHSSVLVDVGCNTGMALLAMAESLGVTRREEPLIVWAFEPNPETFVRLKEIIEQQRGLEVMKRHRIQLVQAAVSDRAGTAPFFHRGAGDLLSGLSKHPGRDEWMPGIEDTEVTVPVVTLDQVLGQQTRVHFLKVDAEGYDPFVLRGARRLLAARRIKFIVFEYDEAWTNAGHNLTLQTAAQELYTQGYLCFFMTKAALLPLYGTWWSDLYQRIRWGNAFCGHKDDYDLFEAYMAHGASNNFTVAYALSSLRSWKSSLGWH